eukprot:6206366-Pleurochrysis_carterae.AAC.1
MQCLAFESRQFAWEDDELAAFAACACSHHRHGVVDRHGQRREFRQNASKDHVIVEPLMADVSKQLRRCFLCRGCTCQRFQFSFDRRLSNRTELRSCASDATDRGCRYKLTHSTRRDKCVGQHAAAGTHARPYRPPARTRSLAPTPLERSLLGSARLDASFDETRDETLGAVIERQIRFGGESEA